MADRNDQIKNQQILEPVLKLKHVMTENVPSICANLTLQDAIQLMNSFPSLDGLPVVNEKGEPYGELTKNRVLGALAEGYPLETPIAAFVNTKDIWVIDEDVDFMSLSSKIKIASDIRNFDGIGIVVDGKRKVAGIVSKNDGIVAYNKNMELLIAQINAVYAAMYNGVITTDLTGRITTINDQAKSYFKYINVQGESLVRVSPAMNKLVLRVINTQDKVIAQKVTINGNPYYVNIAPIVSKNKIIGTVSTLQEIKDLENLTIELDSFKNLYNTLETVMNIDYDGIVIVDNQGIISFTNSSFENFTGKSQDELVRTHITAHIPDCQLHKVVQSGIPIKNIVSKFQGTNYVMSCIPMKHHERCIGGVGKVIFNNFHEIKELADKIESMSSKLSYYENELLKRKAGFDAIITNNEQMIHVLGLAQKTAKTGSTVLLMGESGTGKDLLARAIHASGDRFKGEFVHINCAAIPENLLESELFGYEGGAFTGAKKQGKPGKFEVANHGTMFLDEIGDMSIGLQAKLLRVLQDGKFERVGAVRPIAVNVRIIAASNQDLEDKVARGTFRADLFYRLNVITLKIPPLRERIDDIPLLAMHFVEEYNKIFSKQVKEISPEVLAVLIKYSWPGNVRELKHAMERIMNFCNERVITMNHLPDYMLEKSKVSRLTFNHQNASQLKTQKDYIEKETIVSALENNKWNKTKAAEQLGISRAWLYRKLKQYRIG